MNINIARVVGIEPTRNMTFGESPATLALHAFEPHPGFQPGLERIEAVSFRS